MLVFEDRYSLLNYLKEMKKKGFSIGFVPTMGALHAGHISLLDYAKKGNDLVICSIYVNPTQFNNPLDLEKYPRKIEQDQHLLSEAGCDILFLPDNQTMYPETVQLNFHFGHLEEIMEGRFRKGHFNGVALIVSKLFHIVQPDRAYFGQKDLQQCAIIQCLVKDLMFDISLKICPTLREEDGLAMSSRNLRLTEENRKIAPLIHQEMQRARSWLLENKPIAEVKEKIRLAFEQAPAFQLEYFEIVDSSNLKEVDNIKEHEQISICIAAYLGEVRLIDNLFLY